MRFKVHRAVWTEIIFILLMFIYTTNLQNFSHPKFMVILCFNMQVES